MQRDRGDLWDWHDAGYRIVVSTNIGYCPKTFRNNMGAGIAWQAARRYPGLPDWYGRQCAERGAETPVLEREDLRLVFFPVKPFRPEDPERGWAQNASLDLIADRARQLGVIATAGAPIAMSTVGAGPKGSGGGLDPREVEELLQRELGESSERVVLVEYDPQASRVIPALAISAPGRTRGAKPRRVAARR